MVKGYIMDILGIGIFVVGLILYFVTKKKAIFLFVAGIGAGIVIGAIWAMSIVNNIIP
jgi:hypothetical protein